MSADWIDITVPLRTGMVHWPGDPDVRIQRIKSIADGDSLNVTTLSMCMHTGTHIDAPLHFLDGGEGMDQMPLAAVVGRARVLAFSGAGSIGAPELARHHIRPGERLLLKTPNSGRCWRSHEFVEDYVALNESGAEFLAERGVETVGIDYLSIGSPGDEGERVHRVLMTAGVWIIEGLDLSVVGAGDYELICLPLRVPRADGAPARAIIRRAGPLASGGAIE
jgi:arylformamidase